MLVELCTGLEGMLVALSVEAQVTVVADAMVLEVCDRLCGYLAQARQ